jgi:hypothetical protein
MYRLPGLVDSMNQAPKVRLGDQPEVPSWFDTLVNVDAALVPIAETAVMQTTMIKDSITAYSTAVGPSSLFKNRFNFKAKFFIIPSEIAR